MTSILIIMIGMQCLQLVVSFYTLLQMREMEERKLAQNIITHLEEKKGMPAERRQKIAEGQKKRWAKKKGATNLIAPVVWPEESRQAVN